MLVVTRYRVPAAEAEEFQALARVAVAVLGDQRGCRGVRCGRALDDVELWVLASEWENVGSYRRALSRPEVKAGAVPLMYRCIDEPSAYEDLLTWTPGTGLAEHEPDLA